MTGRGLGAAFSGLLFFLLAACSGPVGLYHSLEGGAIAQHRQAPPGADQPYPNLANVPPAPAAEPTVSAEEIAARVHGTGTGVSPASAAALDGLNLPSAPPPLPNVPGLNLPATPSTAPVPPVAPPAPKPPAYVAPVSLAFVPGSALLPFRDDALLRKIAAGRGEAKIRVGGFGDGVSLNLALARARRLADALTAYGVPSGAILLVAMEAGSGGFAQLVY
jgi:hypothetical protein